MLVMDYSGSMQFRAHWSVPNWYGYYGSYESYGYNGQEGDKANKVYDPTQTYYGIFQSNAYYTYDVTNKYWVQVSLTPAGTGPVTAYVFTDKSQDGGPVAAWGTARAYAVNALVSDSGKSYMCIAAHTSASTSEPGSGANWTNYWRLVGTGTELIQFTASGQNFQVGQLVEFQGLTSHTGMNGNAFYVTAVSGSTFKVAFPWNGNPDQASGSVQRRVAGTLLTTYAGVAQTPGLSGNILNYGTASRIDAALQALIGGPGICDTNYCYIRGQGERDYLRESTNLQAEFYIRMADNDSTATYPDNYSSGTYTTMTTYLSLSGRYTGGITSADPSFSTVCTHQTCTSGHYTSFSCPAGQCTDFPCTQWTCTDYNCPAGNTCSKPLVNGKCPQTAKCGGKSIPNSPWVCDQTGSPCITQGACDQCNNQPGPCAAGPSCPGWTGNNWQCDISTCDQWDMYNYEAWTFTTGSTATHVDLTATGTWTGTGTTTYLSLFNTTRDNFRGPISSPFSSQSWRQNPSRIRHHWRLLTLSSPRHSV